MQTILILNLVWISDKTVRERRPSECSLMSKQLLIESWFYTCWFNKCSWHKCWVNRNVSTLVSLAADSANAVHMYNDYYWTIKYIVRYRGSEQARMLSYRGLQHKLSIFRPSGHKSQKAFHLILNHGITQINYHCSLTESKNMELQTLFSKIGNKLPVGQAAYLDKSYLCWLACWVTPALWIMWSLWSVQNPSRLHWMIYLYCPLLSKKNSIKSVSPKHSNKFVTDLNLFLSKYWHFNSQVFFPVTFPPLTIACPPDISVHPAFTCTSKNLGRNFLLFK